VLQNVLDIAVALKNSELEIEKLIQELVKEDTRVELLQTVPGVGFLTAVAFLATPEIFSSATRCLTS